MEPNVQVLTEKVKTNRLRLTKQRRIIYEELSKVTSHPRADEVYEMVRKRIPHIGIGTVYRNLKTLAQLGLIIEGKFGHNYSHFDANTAPHHHFTCMTCDRVFDVDKYQDIDFSKFQLPALGFRIHHSRVELYGTCDGCEKNHSDSETKDYYGSQGRG